jgi:hypothetical protein
MTWLFLQAWMLHIAAAAAKDDAWIEERKCDHDRVGVVAAAERAAALAFQDQREAKIEGDVLDQVRSDV